MIYKTTAQLTDLFNVNMSTPHLVYLIEGVENKNDIDWSQVFLELLNNRLYESAYLLISAEERGICKINYSAYLRNDCTSWNAFAFLFYNITNIKDLPKAKLLKKLLIKCTKADIMAGLKFVGLVEGSPRSYQVPEFKQYLNTVLEQLNIDYRI